MSTYRPYSYYTKQGMSVYEGFQQEVIEQLRHSLAIAAELLEKHTNMCPREWYEVPWDCNTKCDNDLTQCWADYLEHEGVKRFVQRAKVIE